QQRVRPLPRDDLLDDLGGDRLDVGGVGELGVGHDRGRVAVDQRHPQPLGLEHPARLGAGVVELARLADDDRAGPDDQDGLQVFPARHYLGPSIRRSICSQKRSKRPDASCGPAAASGWYWTLNAGRSSSLSPSTQPSLRLTWVTSAGP